MLHTYSQTIFRKEHLMKNSLVLVTLILGFVFAAKVTPLNYSPTSTSSEVMANTKVCVDLNNASFDELQSITHVGIDEAIAILRFRRTVDFRFADDLSYISGISTTELAEIKAEGLACVSPV